MRRLLTGSILTFALLAALWPSTALALPYFQCWAGFVDPYGQWRCTEIAWCEASAYTGDWYCDVYRVPGL
jgi:hypothetical protein